MGPNVGRETGRETYRAMQQGRENQDVVAVLIQRDVRGVRQVRVAAGTATKHKPVTT
jgi:hypothetical protein